MSKKPIYMRTKKNSYWVMLALVVVVGGLFYGLAKVNNFDYLVENSELKGRSFQGKVEPLIAKKDIDFYFMRLNETPVVVLSFLFDRSGSAYETKEGIANLTASAMLYGADDLSTEMLQEEMEQKGIGISFATTKDVFEGRLIAPKEYLEDAVRLLQKVLNLPRFEKRYLDNAKDVVIKSLVIERESPASELNLEFVKKIYGNHPYGKNILGNEQSVMALTQSDLKNFVKDNMSLDNLVVGLVGNLTIDEAKALVSKVFEDLGTQKNIKKVDDVLVDWQQKVLNVNRESGQNIAIRAAKGTCRKCSDFYPLYVANYLFGGAGLNSRLNQEIREKAGLTYGGYSYLLNLDKVDLIISGFSATKENFAKVDEMMSSEWDKIRKNGFSEEELKMAKDFLIASHNLRFASTSNIADMLVYMQKEDLGADFFVKRNSYVENVTLEQVNDAARKYFGTELLKANIGIFE